MATSDVMPWEMAAQSGPPPSGDVMPWEMAKSPQAPDPGMFNTISDNAVQGATFGLGNRAEAALASPFLAAMHSGRLSSMVDPDAISQEYQNARAYEQQRLRDEMQQHPVASIASNLGGGLATGEALAEAAPAAAASFGNWLRAGNTGARIAKGAGTGAITGAAYGAGTADEGKALEGAEQGAIAGGLTGGAIPAAGAALSDVGNTALNAAKGIFAKSPEAVQDAAAAMKSAAGSIYDKMRQVGATFNPQAARNLISDLQSIVSGGQFISELNPKTTAIVNHIQSAAQDGSLSLGDLDQYRRMLGRIGNTEDGVSAGSARNAIDNFVNNAQGKDLVGGLKYTPQDLNNAQDELQKLQGLHDNLVDSIQGKAQLAGKQGGFWRNQSVTEAADDAKNLANVKQQIQNQSSLIDRIKDNIANAPLAEQKANQAVSLLNQGRKAYQQASKFEDISDILSKADNDPNKIKTGLSRFLANPDNTKGWTSGEIAQLKFAANSTGMESLMKGLGRFGFEPKNVFMPSVGGAAAAATLGNPAAAGLVVGGTLARQGQKYAARGAAQNLLNTLQNGGGRAASTPISTLLSAPAASAAQQIESKSPATMPQTLPTQAIASQSQPLSYETTESTQVQPQPFNSAMQDGLMQAFSKAESGGKPNAKNPNSSASGLMQFTDGTWKQMVKRYGDQTGITMQDKNDPAAQTTMAKLYAKDNVAKMQPFLNRLPTKGELYAAHVFGADGALRLINAANNTPDKQAIMLFPRAVTAGNRSIFFNGNQPRTVSEVYQIISKKVS